jgi:transforming growth factor-beta-induced protein
MKTFLKSLQFVLLIAFAVLALVACGSDDDDSNAMNSAPTMDIVETAVADGRFTTLVAALQAAELDDDLAGAGPFTVFAPTDDAFDLLPAGTVAALLDPANQATLIDILTFHVFSGDVRAADVVTLGGTAATMLNGKDLRIDVISGAVVLSYEGNREAMVVITDILATNGVIHVIDVVLDPADATQDIVDTAVADGRFTTLVTAVTAAGLVDTLKSDGPLTVFAPTDDAFAKLPPGTIAALLADIPTLTNILTYHVYNGSVLAADAIALDGMTVDMFNGGGMNIDVVGGNVVLNWKGGREATVTITNVLCSNGTIHVIDTVLDPNDAP